MLIKFPITKEMEKRLLKDKPESKEEKEAKIKKSLMFIGS